MYDPDSPKVRAPLKSFSKELPTVKPSTCNRNDILPAEAVFRWQLENSVLIREAHGISLDKGKVNIIDKERLAKLEEWKKEVIRDFWRERNKP